MVKGKNRFQAKISKLFITKFGDTSLDWSKFWNQFQAEIDKVEMSPKSKFSYFKKLFAMKVRMLVEGLYFTAEVYFRVKLALETKFRKPSEVAAGQVQCIIYLSVVPNINLNRTYEFLES